MMYFSTIHSTKELPQLIKDVGFLPFFQNDIPIFPIEEYIDSELWFSDMLNDSGSGKGQSLQVAIAYMENYFRKKLDL